MELSKDWERRLDTGYEWGSAVLLGLTKAGNVVSLLQPSPLGDGTVDGWRRTHGEKPLSAVMQPKAPRGTTLKSIQDTLNKVEQALLSLSLISESLVRLKAAIQTLLDQDGQAALDNGQVIAGYEKNALISFTNEEVLQIYSNMSKFIGKDAANKIVKPKDNEDRLLLVSFLDISQLPRVSQETKNVSTRRNASSGPLSFRGVARRRQKMSTVDSSNIMEIALASFGDWNSWGIDYPALKQVLARQQATFATVEELGEIMAAVAPALNVPVQAIQAVIHLECGWPDHIGRRNSGYRNSMTRDDGSTLYRGVSQASKAFWIDVSERLRQKGIDVAGVPERATLAAQVVAPFIYADRYRRSPVNGKYLTDWPLTPGIIYSFHQQSRQGLGNGFSKIAGNQSGISSRVVLATGRLYRRNAPVAFF